MKTSHLAISPPRRLANLPSLLLVAVLLAACTIVAHARTWSNPDGTKTLEGELKSYDPARGLVEVVLPDGKELAFNQHRLSAADIAFLKEKGASAAPAAPAGAPASYPKVGIDQLSVKHDGKAPDMSKPVQVFILLGQSNMVGAGRIGGIENAVKNKNLYPYLVDDSGNWATRADVRYVRFMSGQTKATSKPSIPDPFQKAAAATATMAATPRPT